MKKIVPIILFVFSLNAYPSDLIITDFTGIKPLLQKNNDTTYIINFWATWCIPCRKEIPDLEEINKKYSAYPVKVILISLDFPSKLDQTLLPFLSKNNIKSEVILLDDPNSNYWINEVDSSWSGAIPATLIYNRKFRKFISNPVTFNELDLIIQQYHP